MLNNFHVLIVHITKRCMSLFSHLLAQRLTLCSVWLCRIKEDEDDTTLTPNAGLTVPCSFSPSSILSSEVRCIVVTWGQVLYSCSWGPRWTPRRWTNTLCEQNCDWPQTREATASRHHGDQVSQSREGHSYFVISSPALKRFWASKANEGFISPDLRSCACCCVTMNPMRGSRAHLSHKSFICYTKTKMLSSSEKFKSGTECFRAGLHGSAKCLIEFLTVCEDTAVHLDGSGLHLPHYDQWHLGRMN